LKLIDLYHHFPYPLKSLTASIYGYYLRSWRYGNQSELLIQKAKERDTWDREIIKVYQEEKLAHILNLAAKEVPYYRRSWEKRRAAGDRSSWEILDNWPILSKEELRANSKEFLVEGTNTRFLYKETTSGTTGSPVTFWCKRSMLIEMGALFEARWRNWSGVTRKDRWGMFGGQNVIPYKQSSPPYWVWNAGLNQLYFSVLHIKPDWVTSYLEAIKKYKLIYLYGYASALYQVAFYMLENNLHHQMKAVITDAEPLYDFQREVISEAFGCKVYETYGQGEMIAAMSECKAGKHHLWPELGYVEVLDKNDEPAAENGSGRLISTGLLNDVMPLIRYDIRDEITVPKYDYCECGRKLPIVEEIFGRKDDALFTSDGRRIFLLDIIFQPEFNIKEAQIIQKSLDYLLIRVVPTPKWHTENEKDITSAIQKRIGQMNIVMEVVQDIPKTWRGKHRMLISELSKSNSNSIG
jgi:phenylacetate-CoA ligase